MKNINFRKKILSLILSIFVITSTSCITFSRVKLDRKITSSDDFTTEEKVSQIERVSDAHAQLLTEFRQQILDNQSDINSLRDQIQKNQHKIDQIVERQNQIISQMRGLNKFENSTEAIALNNQDDRFVQNIENFSRSNAEKDQQGNINQEFLNNDYNDYYKAISLIKERARQNETISIFKNFIKKYPNSNYQSNANYWLGQLNYSKGEKSNAVCYFAFVVKNYPNSQKAPEAMYKIGLIMQEQGNLDKAKAIYQKVLTTYTNSSIAKYAQERLSSIEKFPE